MVGVTIDEFLKITGINNVKIGNERTFNTGMCFGVFLRSSSIIGNLNYERVLSMTLPIISNYNVQGAIYTHHIYVRN